MRTTPPPAASELLPQVPDWAARAFTTAAKHFQAGLLDEARQLLVLILERLPQHSDSLFLLGSIAYHSSDLPLSESLLRQAIAIDSHKAPFWVLLGNIFQRQGRFAESLQCYETASTLDPQSVDVYYNAGNSLNRQGDHALAIRCFEKALELVPNHLEALNNLGIQYRHAGRHEEALLLLQRAEKISPNAGPVLLNLGNVLMSLGRNEEALEQFDRCVRMDPHSAILRNNKANALRALGKLSEAMSCWRAGLAIDPDAAELWVNYAAGLHSQGRQKEALEAYQRILHLAPDNAVAHGAALFSMHYDATKSTAQLLSEHQAWGAKHADPLLPANRVFHNARQPDKRLRVGYVSVDFRRHPVAFFTLPVFRNHSNAVEAICYSGVTRPDQWSDAVQNAVSGWRSIVGWSDSELCAQVQKDEVDILVDLAGHTAGNRLLAFARRAAPVQVSWLGYFNTTGMRAMDYLVVDPVVAPESEQAPFVEQALRLPGCYLAYQGPDYAPAVAAPPCLTRPAVTFGCFNTQAKITPEVIAVWARILHTAPDSRILLKNATLDDEGCRQLVNQEFAAQRIAPDRVELRGASPHAELLASYAEVDIALDPFPYHGGTTTCEALWMGLPVVTLRGDRFVSRVGPTILHHAGFPQWVAQDLDHYVQIALDLAADPDKLAVLRAGLRERVRLSPLGDIAGFTRSWEDALRMVWRRWCGSE